MIYDSQSLIHENAVMTHDLNLNPHLHINMVSAYLTIFLAMLYSRLVEPSRHGTDKATSRD